MPYDPYAEDDVAPGYGSAVAFDEPREDGLRYPIAMPLGGSWTPPYTPPAVTPEFSPNGGRYLPGSENLQALPGGGYNQAYAAEELRTQQAQDPQAIQQAIRLKGLMKYQQLVRDGASSQEALRLSAPELYFNHPQAMSYAMRSSEIPRMPQLQTVQGGRLLVNPSGTAHYIPNPVEKAIPAVKDVAPPDVKALQYNNKALIRQAEGELERQTKALEKAETPDEKSAYGRAALAARTELQRLMNENVTLSTNYARPSSITPPNIVKQETPPPAEDDMVPVIGPDGVRGRVPRSKLDAAKKQGYKER